MVVKTQSSREPLDGMNKQNLNRYFGDKRPGMPFHKQTKHGIFLVGIPSGKKQDR
jgi:hypothetical protein